MSPTTPVTFPYSGGSLVAATPPRRLIRLLTAAAALPAVAVTLEFLHGGYSINLFETGTLLAGGTHMLHGERLYSDVFAFYGPLAYLYPTIGGRLIPGSAWGLLLPDLLLGMLSGVVSFLLALKLSHRTAGAFAAPVLTAILSGNGVRTLPALVAVFAISHASPRSGGRSMIAAGVATGIGLLWWQDSGVWIAVSVVTATAAQAVGQRSWRETTPRLGPWLLGVALIVTPWFAYLAVRGDFSNWFYYCFIFPNQQYTRRSSFGYVTTVVQGWAGQSPLAIMYHVIFYLGPYLVVVLTALIGAVLLTHRLFRGDNQKDLYWITVLALYALLQVRILIASVDESKLASVLPPVLILAFLGLRPRKQLRSSPRSARARATLLVAVLPLAYLMTLAVQSQIHRAIHATNATTSSGSTVLSGPALAGATPPSASVSDVETVTGWLRSHSRADQTVLILPNQPLFYYLANRDSPVPFDYLDPTYVSGAADASMAETLASSPPAVVVLADSVFPGTNLMGKDIAPRTYGWLKASFTYAGRVGPFQLLVPRP